jgi:2-haloalkanoic acid dehalogenase type II
MVRIRAVLFDLGGTLIDERDFETWTDLARSFYLDLDAETLAHAYTEVVRETDGERLGADQAARMAEFWRRVLSRAAERDVPLETARRFDAARGPARRRLTVFSDVRRCLEELQQDRRALAVVSNSTSEAHVRQLLDRAGILDFFAQVVSSGTEGFAKPSPEIFRRAVQRLGIQPAEALHVGDLPRTDAQGARGAGLFAVWLNRDGTGFCEDPPEITSLLEVPTCVRRIERGASPT